MLDFLSKWWPAILAGAGGTYVAAKVIRPSPPPSLSPSPSPVKVPPMSATALTSYIPDDFFPALGGMVARFQSKGAHVSGRDMLVMFLAESDCDSRIANSIGCAGLNQICNLKGVGFTEGVKAYTALPPAEQLKYVEKYFDNVNKYPMMRDVGSLYLTNFSPAFLGKPDNFVMYRRDPNGPEVNASSAEWRAWLLVHKGDRYGQNRGVDFGRKGYIEVADMAKFMNASVNSKRAKLDELVSRYAALTAEANA